MYWVWKRYEFFRSGTVILIMLYAESQEVSYFYEDGTRKIITRPYDSFTYFFPV